MATGFKSIQRNQQTDDTGYETLFEKITKKTEGEKKPLSWYRAAVKSESKVYGTDNTRYISAERRDSTGAKNEQDQNMVRRYVVAGHLYMFEYKAKMRWLPYYDRFPLVYVIKSNKNEFFGANLHYLPIKRRILAVNKLLKYNRIEFPKKCFHKYLHSHVDGFYLDLASAEWDTAILLPTEDFVKDVNGHVFPYPKEDVWKETNDSYYDNIKATRVIEGYGKASSKQMVK